MSQNVGLLGNLVMRILKSSLSKSILGKAKNPTEVESGGLIPETR